MPFMMQESMAGQVYHKISDVIRISDLGGNKPKTDMVSEDQKCNTSILIIPNKSKKNLKVFDLLVTDNEKNKYAISRNLKDLVWLRNNLRIDFPFSYVNAFC
jgi:hypothetical protein